MSDYKTDRTDRTIPSGCPSPARVEKTDSSSSRQSGSPIYWDFESWIVSDSLGRSGRIRPSSWDDSDDDLSPKNDISKSKTCQIYSSDSKEIKNSVSYEINKLKKQFFESLEKEKANNHDGLGMENLREKLEITLKCDRRQSPARIRRRSRSSSSSSPILDTKCQNSPEGREKLTGFDLEQDESEQMSPRILETDSKYYLNNFFTELRSKRISMLDPMPMDKITQESILISDDMKLEMLNELNALEINDDGGFFCKTSRKLSQILEVEENKRDFERSSEENMQKSESIAGDSDKFSEKNFSITNLTIGSNDSGKILPKSQEIKKTKNEDYKSFSFEKLGNNEKVATLSRDSLSERSARLFDRKLDDDFINLCAKSGKTHLSSPKRTNNRDPEKPFQFFCLTNALGGNKCFLGEPIPEREDKGNESKVNEHLEIDFDTPTMCESPTSGKSTDRSRQSQSSRTKSGKTKRSSNPESPKFVLSVGGDSERSLREVNTGDSQQKSKRSTPSERKLLSLEDRSSRKSSKSSSRSEVASDLKTERNLHLQLESLSLDSGKSSPRSLYEQRTASRNSKSGRSSRRLQRSEKEREGKNIEHNLALQNVLENTKTESPVLSSRGLDKVNISSYRSVLSEKLLTPVQYFSDEIPDRETSRNEEIPNVEVTERSDFQKMSSRSAKTGELELAIEDIDQRQPRTPSQRSSERSSISERSKKSTARSLRRQITSKTNEIKLKNNTEPQEMFPVSILQDSNIVSDALSSYTPIDSSKRRSSWRESDFPSRESSSRRGTFDREGEISSNRENAITPKLLKLTDERLFSSRRSSARSLDSYDKMSATQSGNITPLKSEKTKSRPSSQTSKESEIASVPFEIEKIDLEALSGRSIVFEEDKEKEEINSIQSGTESDRPSNKRLSVINEVSYEDFETVNISNSENDERNFWDNSRPQSKLKSRRNSPESEGSDKNRKMILKDSSKGSARSFKEKTESNLPKEITTEGRTWSELIETFEGRESSEFFSENNFPGFPPRKEENSSRLPLYSSVKESFEKPNENEVEHTADSLKNQKKSIDHKMETPKSERKDQQQKENFDLSLVTESLYEKSKTENERSFQSLQNLYYVEVDRGGPFGIGEFGDISCWRVGKPDTRDLNKPRDHGDGVQVFKSSEVIFVKPEKKEKEMKTQRQLWTDLREDFRDFGSFSNDLFPVTGADVDVNHFIPLGLKTSKSDNCINRKLSGGSECYSSTTFDLSHDNNKPENINNKLLKNDRKSDSNPKWKNTAERSSSESLNSPKEEEFDIERTPRLSRSLSNLDVQIKIDRPKEFGSSGIKFFENPEISKKQKESVNLNIFLARKAQEETAVKENNWLSLKSQETKKPNRRDKKAKARVKKGSNSSEEPSGQYLTTRSRSSVPSLKLRRSNCFQNFYKRFISVFCVTSNSSAATSK